MRAGLEPSRLATAGLAAILAFPSACSDAPEDVSAETSGVVVRDSAGIEIVENSGDAIPPDRSWRLGAEPRVRIGVAEGDPAYQLFRVGSALILPDGGVAILNVGSDDLRFFDRSGIHLRTVGGTGEGPEEFTGPWYAGWFDADTIGVADASLGRISLFDAQGEFIRTFVPPSVLESRTTPHSFGGDGWVTMEASVSRLVRSPEELDRLGDELPSTFVQVREDGTSGDAFDRFMFEIAIGELSGERAPVPMNFQRNGLLTSGPGVIVYADNRSRQFEILDGAGAIVRLVRHSEPFAPITPELLERYFESVVSGETDPVRRTARLEQLRDRPTPDTLATAQRLVVDRSNGNVWVMGFQLPWDEAVEWLVFSPDGIQLTRLQVPAQHRIMDIADGSVLIRATDDLGVERVLLYDLIMPE